MRLVIVDDHPMWRDTLRNLLEHAGIGSVVGEAGNGDDAVEVSRSTCPDVVIMDINLPGVDGVEATGRVLEALPRVKVLVLASSDDPDVVARAVRAGAAGYLLKTATPEEVADAVARIDRGELVFPPTLAGVVLQQLRRGGGIGATGEPDGTAPDARPGIGSLTAREQEVLGLMAEGHSNQGIAEQLFLNPKTVEAHVRSIFLKLGLEPGADVHRRVAAVIAYLRGTDPPSTATRPTGRRGGG